jgi:hypothetical protein
VLAAERSLGAGVVEVLAGGGSVRVGSLSVGSLSVGLADAASTSASARAARFGGRFLAPFDGGSISTFPNVGSDRSMGTGRAGIGDAFGRACIGETWSAVVESRPDAI